MRHFILMLFALAGGLTLSGIVANFYRLIASKPHSRIATWAYYGVMLLAGPSVLFENSTRSFRKRECSRGAYAFAVGLAGYWSLVLGLALINVSELI
jgi:hypothetical protein